MTTMNDDDYQKLRDFFVDLIKMYDTGNEIATSINMGDADQETLLHIQDRIASALAAAQTFSWSTADQLVVDQALGE